MTRSRILGLALVALCSLLAVARAQEPKPTITLVVSSQENFLADLEQIVSSLAKSPNEYTTLKDFLEVLLIGTDPKSALSYRTFVVGKETREVYTLPVSTLAAFRDLLGNLKDLGYSTTRDPLAPRGVELYKFTKSDTGSVLFNPKTKLVQIVPIGDNKNKAAQAAARAAAQAIKSPAPATLLAGRDVILVIENEAANTADRKAAFATLTANLHTTLERKLPNETEHRYKLRVAGGKQQIAELERFFVEAAKVVVGSTTKANEGNSVLDAEVSGLPQTSLAKAIDDLGKNPDEFAAVSSKDTIARGNINVPVPEFRKKAVQELSNLWLPAISARIDTRTDLSADARQSEKDIAQVTTQIINDVAELGTFNGFIRVYKKGEEYTQVGAVKVASGAKLVELLKTMQDRKAATVKLNVEKIGEAPAGGGGAAAPVVSLHAITVPHLAKDYAEFFGADDTLYLGTSESTIWIAHGEDALPMLKQHIQEVTTSGPKETPLLIDADMAILQWVRAWDRRQADRGQASVRKAAIEGLQGGKDTFTVQLWKDEKDPRIVRLKVVANEGLLRAAGRITATVVKEKFE